MMKPTLLIYVFLTKEQDGWRIKKALQAEIC